MAGQPFTMIPNRVVRCSKLTNIEHRILLVILSWGNPNTQDLEGIWVHNPTIAQAVGIDDLDCKQVRRAIRSMKAKGVFAEIIKGGWRDGQNRANTYFINWDFFEECPVTDDRTPRTRTTGHSSADEGKTSGQGRPYGEDKDDRTIRSAATVPGGQGRPYRTDKDDRQEKTLKKNREEKTGKNNPPEETLSARFASESQEPTTLVSEPSEGDIILGIPNGMHRERYIELIKKWKAQVGTLTLTKELVNATYKLLGIEEKRTGETLNPDLIIQAVQHNPLPFRSLFQADGQAFTWNRLQRENPLSCGASPKASPASSSGEGHAPASGVVAARKAQPEPVDHAQALSRALAKKAAKKAGKQWPDQGQVEAIYQAYPRKVGKADALKSINTALLNLRDGAGNEDAYGFLIERVQLYAKSEAGNNGKYTPHPATWMNQMRYLDDEKEWNPKSGDASGNIVRVVDDLPPPDCGPTLTDDDLLN